MLRKFTSSTGRYLKLETSESLTFRPHIPKTKAKLEMLIDSNFDLWPSGECQVMRTDFAPSSSIATLASQL